MSSKPSLNHAHVLVTGGAGFIGSHLVQGLLAEGARVRVLDDFSTGRRENLGASRDDIEIIEGDLRNLDVCVRAMQRIESVVHLAALVSVPRSLEAPAETIAVNVTGTANLLQAARDAGVRRVVYASSASVYGDDAPEPSCEGREGTPKSTYARSKALVEQLAHHFAQAFGLSTLGLRYFNVYGPRQNPKGDYASVIPRFFAARAAGLPPVIYGSGEQSRDFVYVGDVVRANLLALTAEAPHAGRYNVGSGTATTVLALAQAIDPLMPQGPEWRFEPERSGDVRHSRADTTLSQRELGFEARTTLLEGLARTAEDYRS